MELKSIIKAGWNGEANLSSAFWLYFVGGQFAVTLALILVISPTLLMGAEATKTAKLVTYPIYFSFLAWAMVSIWRCANNVSYRVWGILAKTFVVVYVGLWVLGYVQSWFPAI